MKCVCARVFNEDIVWIYNPTHCTSADIYDRVVYLLGINSVPFIFNCYYPS